MCVCERERQGERERVGVTIVWRRECGGVEEDKRKRGPELAASHTPLASTTSLVSLRFFIVDVYIQSGAVRSFSQMCRDASLYPAPTAT